MLCRYRLIDIDTQSRRVVAVQITALELCRARHHLVDQRRKRERSQGSEHEHRGIGDRGPEWRAAMDLHRVQLEHSLRTKLLTLRQSYLQAVGDDNRVRRLMLDSASTFSTLFRHTLIAMAEQPAPRKADNIRKLAERLKFDPGIFLQLLQVREHTAKENDIEAVAGFARYLAGINTVVEAVDAL